MRIARKTNAFGRNNARNIELAVRILVMDQGHCIIARRHVIKRDVGRFCGRHLQPARLWIVAAIREMVWRFGHADQDVALIGAQAMEVDINRGARRGAHQERGGDQSAQAHGPCDRDGPKIGNISHSFLDTRHGGVGGVSLLSANVLIIR